jgi:hypothetical protein
MCHAVPDWDNSHFSRDFTRNKTPEFMLWPRLRNEC